MSLKRINIEPYGGEKINEYAKRLIDYFNKKENEIGNSNFYIIGKFNNVKIIVTESSTVNNIVNDYNARLEDNNYDFMQSDSYKKLIKQQEKEIKVLNYRANEMMNEFKKIDKKEKLALINWLEDFQYFSSNKYVQYDKARIIVDLRKAGYIANTDCNIDSYSFDNFNDYGNWIIGWCLGWLDKYGEIHRVIHRYAHEYREWVSRL